MFLLIKREFDYTVITGALLGTGVTVLNFFILSFSVNRAINKYIEARGEAEMDEEAAAEFTKAHSMSVQNAMMKSYLLRMAIMIGALFGAMFTGWFNVITAVIPLVTYRPVMYAVEFIKNKSGKRGE